MGAAKVSFETVFLRDFARSYVSEIAFTNGAMADLNRCGIGLADVLHVLRNGRVTISEKESPDGARWQVEGDTCDNDSMSISLHVWCDRYSMRILRIMRIGATDV